VVVVSIRQQQRSLVLHASSSAEQRPQRVWLVVAGAVAVGGSSRGRRLVSVSVSLILIERCACVVSEGAIMMMTSLWIGIVVAVVVVVHGVGWALLCVVCCVTATLLNDKTRCDDRSVDSVLYVSESTAHAVLAASSLSQTVRL